MIADSVIQYKQKGQWHNAKCDRCLYDVIGDYADIYWDIQVGKMKICKSQSQKSSYEINNGIQIIKKVHFCHSEVCPLSNDQIAKNPERDVKPCACVLLQNQQNKQILLTKRALKLSFPGAWVLPGGHLQKNQTIIRGGIRQCQEQVGLPIDSKYKIHDISQLMVWQSVYTIQNKVKASGLVIFFRAQCPNFDVKILEQQVIDFRWKKIDDSSDQIPYSKQAKQGYAQGHRRFLKIIRNSLK